MKSIKLLTMSLLGVSGFSNLQRLRLLSKSSPWIPNSSFSSLSPSKTTVISAKKSTNSLTMLQSQQRQGEFWEARLDDKSIWRPTINDVERISWGKPAKKKGTGSRGVPHRLNEEERKLFDQARRKGYLEIVGSGWRSQRREAPLLNTYRSLCDARGQVAIVLHKQSTGIDDVVIDLSPLRNPETFDGIAKKCLEYQPGGEIVRQTEFSTTEETTGEEVLSPWETKPIYHLPPYCIAWELERSDAKTLGKKMSELFDTSEGKSKESKKPLGVKPGKSRRHGGYGIG